MASCVDEGSRYQKDLGVEDVLVVCEESAKSADVYLIGASILMSRGMHQGSRNRQNLSVEDVLVVCEESAKSADVYLIGASIFMGYSMREGWKACNRI